VSDPGYTREDRRQLFALACAVGMTHSQELVMRLWRDGLGYQRIGLLLGLPRDTVRGRIVRVLSNVARELDREAA
jgi:DNA-directed RNA polymerase specialized sigma24 family protein